MDGSMPARCFIICAGLVALAASVPLHAQQKPTATYADGEAAAHAGEEATVTGKVVAVSKSAKGTLYLNFGDRFPRQTFSGVVLARDQEKVGDLKSYEGKSVALTGRIELSPDQKPQILISTPEQIKLAEPGALAVAPSASTPAAPMPAPIAAAPAIPVPVAPAVPAPKPAVAAKKIALAPNWNSPAQGGEMTRKDLAHLFGGHASASESSENDSPIVVYPEIPFLTPLGVAKKILKLEGASASTSKVTCPGLPLGSFSAQAYSGVFPGGFNRLFLITDNADQVVSVLLADENSRQRATDVTDALGYHTYNFITNRVKGSNDLIIKHEITAGAPAGVVVVDSALIDPETAPKTSASTRSTKSTARIPRTGKVLDRSRWYVPVPVVNLILRCVGNR